MYTSMFRKAMLGDTALLSLDFTTGTMPSAVTFTRADSTARATYIDANGYVKTVASAGEARFNRSGINIGLLIESAATNFVTYSQALTANNYGMMALSIDGTLTDPMGGTDSSKVAANSANGGHQFLKYINAGAGITTVTVSIYAKKNGYKYLFFSDGILGRSAARFDLDSGAVDNTLGAGFVSALATPAGASGSGWWRCSMTSTVVSNTQYGWSFAGAPTSLATYSINSASYQGTGLINDGIYAIGFQVEAGAGASSLIPTTTAALTRLADDAVIRSTAWTSLYAQPGAMVVEFYRGAYGTGDRSIMSTDPTAARHWHLKNANASATAQIAFSAGSPVTQTGLIAGLNKVAIAWNAPTPTASFDLCVNGATPTFGGSNVGTTLSTWLTLGSQSTTGVSGTGVWDGYLNNSIKSVKYYTGLTYAEMQAKTT